MGFFKKGANKLEAMKNKYSKAEANVNKIVETLEKHQIQLMKDAAIMDKMYALNLNYFKELSMYILAGKEEIGRNPFHRAASAYGKSTGKRSSGGCAGCKGFGLSVRTF